MSETANLKIVAPDAKSVLVPLHSHFAALASTVDDAVTSRFQIKQLRYETDSQRTADYDSSGKSSGKPDLADGDMCLVNSKKRQFFWNFNGTSGAWQPVAKRFVFASISERDALSVEDVFEGDSCYVTEVDLDFVYINGAWDGGVWKDWTSTVTGWTGAVVNYARYRQHGKTVHYQIKITGVGNAPAACTISAPVTGNATTCEADAPAGTGSLRMTSPYVVIPQWLGATTWRPMFTTSTAGLLANFSSATPATYVTGAILRLSGTYEAA
jgi:hypothetical protein